MLRKVKRFLLVVPMIACMFALSVTEQQTNAMVISTVNNSNNTNVNHINNNTGTIINNTNIINNGSYINSGNVVMEPLPLQIISCSEVETVDIPPIFGFCGFSISFASGCGDSNQSCVGVVASCGGRVTVHIECSNA
jgi:hypothetical protein